VSRARAHDPAGSGTQGAGLIQRANQAYERNDLLELLSLQVETEQIDAGALANVPEDTLKHYNDVLTDQARALEAQVNERAALFRIQFNLHRARPDAGTRGPGAERKDRRDEQRAQTVPKRSEAPRGPERVPCGLDDLPDPEDALDLDDMALLEAIFDDPLRPGSPTRQWRKRRKR
jgi:hypothetical protein